MDPPPPHSLLSLRTLIKSRLHQEYFDRFMCQENRLYSVWPRVTAPKEIKATMEKQRNEFLSNPEETFIGDMLVLTPQNCTDEIVLRVPRV